MDLTTIEYDALRKQIEEDISAEIRKNVEADLSWEIMERLESVRRETWNKFSDLMPNENELILVTNKNYVEISYMEKGKIMKPWAYDKNDTSVYKTIDDKLLWKYVNVPK